MAVSAAIIDYDGGAGDRNFTVYIQLTFSGSYTAGGEVLNLSTLTNPNGLDVEGVFELPLTLLPGVFVESIGGYYVQPVLAGASLTSVLVQVFSTAGTQVSGAYSGLSGGVISSGTVILAIKKRRV